MTDNEVEAIFDLLESRTTPHAMACLPHLKYRKNVET
ncbi:hypothetical protein EV679_1270 [Kerstersia gyiorum]|jgi:hypothetical protein|uniref:Uncharacterized protein n=1 Tax=Kerstersia gyiorum TaxID=206506 RepID=A0A4Q7N0N6_9BURK|nr:hypothetical protein [Kerstersia gyiorum]MCP1638265.1 hypothetical protein [Kerstersia gyiorum]MCP1672858.1 hypothetical protein [Kerstersia gyiorum]MCP1680674.1 hypothetical protein [Kerstersia gyiorum]MCP1684053.1 hypothetical protein [Kerstersia gyiorum]